MAVKLLQDIHLSDKELWSNFQVYWNGGNYVAAVNLLNANQQLVTKYVSADWLNGLTTLVYVLENNSDPIFKADRIVLSFIPPSLESGQVYFQLEDSNTIINVYMDIITSSNTSVAISYDDTLINFMAFQNLQQVDTDVQLTSGTVTFSVAEALSESIICLVFSSADVNVYSGTITNPSTSTSVSFSGTLLNAYVVSSQYICNCDITVGNGTVIFSVPSLASGITLTCYVVSIANTYISQEVGTDTGTISTSSTSVTLDCDGYLINHILTQNNNIIKTDVELVGTKVVISTIEQPSSSINATVYYT